MGLCDGNSRSDVNCDLSEWTYSRDGFFLLTAVFVDDILEETRRKMSPRVHGHNLLLVSPLWERANGHSWFRVGEVRSVVGLEFLACNCQSVVDGVRASVS